MIRLVTHSGRFHADDVFATSALSILFEKQNKEFELIRSRKSEDIESGDIVYDNGREYNPDKKIFDHHQEGGAGERDNKVPYAAFGLIWKHYGQEIVLEFFEGKLEKEKIDKIHKLVDEVLVQPIDAGDTGCEDYSSDKEGLRSYVPDSFVLSFNPTNKEGYENSYDLFMQSVNIAKQILERELLSAEAKIAGIEKVKNIYESSEDKRIIVLDEGGSWKEVLVKKEEPMYVIFPTVDADGWMIQAVTKELSGYDVRKSFPENWCGKAGEELEKETGVEGSKFCHLKGFLCVTETKDQALEIAKIAVDK